MICPVCGCRFTTLRKDHWKWEMDEKNGLHIVTINNNAVVERNKLYDDDYNKYPCYDCILK